MGVAHRERASRKSMGNDNDNGMKRELGWYASFSKFPAIRRTELWKRWIRHGREFWHLLLLPLFKRR